MSFNLLVDFARDVIRFLLVVAVFLPHAHADPAPLNMKPEFEARSKILVPPYVESKMNDAAARQAEAAGRIARAQDGDPGDLDSYDRGANYGEIMMNSWEDFSFMLTHFFGCAEPKQVGLCYRPYPFEIGEFWEYYLPKQFVEVVAEMFNSGFTEEYIIKFVLELMDNVNSPASAYSMVPRFAPKELAQAVNIASDFARFFGGQFVPRPPALPPDGSIGADALAPVRETYSKEQRFRNASGGGVNYAEYRVMPTHFEERVEQLGLASFLFFFPRNHIKHDVGQWHSDFPMAKMFSTFAQFSYFIFPKEMSQLYGAPYVGTGSFPLACVGEDMREGRRRGGGSVHVTAPDMLKQFPDRSGFNARLASAPGDGCVGLNHGPWAPPLSAKSGEYAVQNAATAAVGGIKAAKALGQIFQIPWLLGGAFYDITFKNHNLHKDKWQWSRSMAVREATKGKCFFPEQFLSIYGPKGLQPGDRQNDHGDRSVIIHWRKFRVCEKGMVPLIAWSGGMKTIYE